MIVTLTTIPPRFAHLGGVLDAIGGQALRPEAVELYVPRHYRRFPGERPALPALPGWVTVIEVDPDLGPATKILPAVQRWRGRAVDLLFCDDDKAYDPAWTTRFAAMRRDRPQDALCEYGRELEHVARSRSLRRTNPPAPRAVPFMDGPRARALRNVEPGADLAPTRHFTDPGYMDVAYGFAGVMIGADWLDDRAFAIPDLLWTVDDVWLSGMLELHGHRIWVGADGPWLAGRTAISEIAPLRDHTEQGIGRFAANAACVTYFKETFGIWG